MSLDFETALQYYTYVCMATFVVGSILRFRHSQQTWKSGSSQMLRQGQLRLGSNLFHLGIITLFFSHTVGLLTPPWIYHAIGISAGFKQKMAIFGGGTAGFICLVGLLILLHRRLSDPRIRKTSSFMDIYILIHIAAQLALGLGSLPISMSHPHGEQMLALCDWVQRVATFRPAAGVLADVHWIFKAHIWGGVTLFGVFPFTRLVHALSVPITYFFRPYQIVRKRR